MEETILLFTHLQVKIVLWLLLAYCTQRDPQSRCSHNGWQFACLKELTNIVTCLNRFDILSREELKSNCTLYILAWKDVRQISIVLRSFKPFDFAAAENAIAVTWKIRRLYEASKSYEDKNPNTKVRNVVLNGLLYSKLPLMTALSLWNIPGWNVLDM